MSVTIATAPTKSLVTGGLLAAAGAAVATTTIAALGHAAGIGLEVAGGPIPVPAFALFTVTFSVLGLVIALAQARWTRRPRTAFVRTTVVLTALSLVPDAVVAAAASTKLLLVLTHLVAAAIVIPAIARRVPA